MLIFANPIYQSARGNNVWGSWSVFILSRFKTTAEHENEALKRFQ